MALRESSPTNLYVFKTAQVAEILSASSTSVLMVHECGSWRGEKYARLGLDSPKSRATGRLFPAHGSMIADFSGTRAGCHLETMMSIAVATSLGPTLRTERAGSFLKEAFPVGIARRGDKDTET